MTCKKDKVDETDQIEEVVTKVEKTEEELIDEIVKLTSEIYSLDYAK
jgi:hypothetical protein